MAVVVTSKPVLRCFSAVVDQRSKVLVLGSMPGAESQRMTQYYAHPRNAFWPIMQSLFSIDACAPYPQRLQALLACGVGLWDVYAECEREGSLDSAIGRQRFVCNDFSGLLAGFPAIGSIFFNGKMAGQTFRRQVLPQLGRDISCYDLPSTSPANASCSFADKILAWQQIREVFHDGQ